jgi:Pregnancy-associated plasma protein-A
MIKAAYINCFLTVIILMFSFQSSLAQRKICKEPAVNMQSRAVAESWGMSNRPEAVNHLVRVYFHISRATQGTYGDAATFAEIESEFATLVQDFAPYNICFANMGVDYVDNSFVNWQLDPDVAGDKDSLLPYIVPDCLNIFYHSGLGSYGGYAYNIPNTFCSVDNDNIGLWHTISHEVGHCLGLSHTFTTSGGEEYINGTNCSTRGDRVCDTPADPYSDSQPCFTANNCVYTGNCQDPSGATNYSPPYQNIMSYWGLEGCTLTHFTTGQYNRAESFLQTDPGLLDLVSPGSVTLGAATVSSGYYLKTARNSISITGNITISGSAKAALESQSVILPAGFTASPGSGGTTIIRSTCGY